MSQEALENLLTRRSCRKYKPDMVPQNLLDQIVAAGLLAPTGLGSQASVIVQVSDPKTRGELAALNAGIMGKDGIDPFYGAPVVFVVLSKKDAPTGTLDGAATIENMLLAAHALGLGSCWIHRAEQEFKQPEGKDLLKSLGLNPDDYIGIDHCIVGYPADGEAPQAAERKAGRFYKI